MTNANQHPTLTGAEILWASLAGEGTTTVFGYPGGAILPIYDALRKFPTIHHVLVRHEQGASHMADGYARASGRVGVCMATSGPGATNLVTGLATAMLDSIPMVAITGQVSSKVLGSDAFQEVDITGITLPVTKHNFLVTRAEDIAPAIREAFQIARSGRPGPVLVDITKDAQQATAVYDFDAAAPPAYRPHPMLHKQLHADSPSIKQALELILAAKKPVILAGHGIVESGAEREVIAFAEALQIPIASTLLGLGAVPAAHPLQLGMMGMHGESWVNNAIQQADLLLAFGMRFDDRVTGNLASYSPNSKKIHIEIDPSEINKNVRVDVSLIGDLKQVLNILLPQIARHSEWSAAKSKNPEGVRPATTAQTFSTTASPWLSEINKSKGSAAVRDIINLPDNGHLYAAHVIHDIWREAQAAGRLENTIIVTDVGQHQMWEAQYFKHESPRSLVTSGGLGTMGFALPAAIGAKAAQPHKDVWVIAGDGGFQMTAAELSTIQQEGLAINIAVINNGFLGMVRQWQETFYDKNYSASPILSPDFVMLAAAHGIAGASVSKRSDVIPTVTKARTSGKPFLINFQVEKEDGVYPMIAPGAALHEMVRRPTHDPLLETAEDE
ncbi:biosynthetic-type acetolactate synthase large subunit [Granulicella sp. 5B5]|uniref:biosynthetic-type acetolactate synthase large subunit n=1 Tax=Granulicella sp. 5B5 TaxID=1617967 RepID=UPI0015F59BEE|nr:biosynthetic-type acetolactate synthase large subunit [Granulicella sp. 5B5]QMV18064.1 biosynthetic-type acetolactate synthase large subunit [Granulicella sp. 5B5]